MANTTGRLIPSQATIRTNTTGVPRPFPSTDVQYAYSLTVSVPNGNAGTMYIACNIGSATNAQTVSNAAVRELTMVRLKAGESYTFTGVPGSRGQYREVAFGTGLTYLHGSATSLRACITYYKLGN